MNIFHNTDLKLFQIIDISYYMTLINLWHTFHEKFLGLSEIELLFARLGTMTVSRWCSIVLSPFYRLMLAFHWHWKGRTEGIQVFAARSKRDDTRLNLRRALGSQFQVQIVRLAHQNISFQWARWFWQCVGFFCICWWLTFLNRHHVVLSYVRFISIPWSSWSNLLSLLALFHLLYPFCHIPSIASQRRGIDAGFNSRGWNVLCRKRFGFIWSWNDIKIWLVKWKRRAGLQIDNFHWLQIVTQTTGANWVVSVLLFLRITHHFVIAWSIKRDRSRFFKTITHIARPRFKLHFLLALNDLELALDFGNLENRVNFGHELRGWQVDHFQI